jgi:hypothetical protein
MTETNLRAWCYVRTRSWPATASLCGSAEMMNVWQEFLHGCQRMPAAPLWRLARTSSEPSRQIAGFAPGQGLRGSVHALPLRAILTTSDQPVHSPAAHAGQGTMRVSAGQRDGNGSRGTGMAASDEITTARPDPLWRMPRAPLDSLRSADASRSLPASWSYEPGAIPARCPICSRPKFPGSVHAMPLSPRTATRSTCQMAVLSRHDAGFSWSAGMRGSSGSAWL